MNNNCWLPELEYFINYNKYENPQKKYENALYEVFKNDFLNNDNSTLFKNKQVHVRRGTMENGKEDAFYHVTTQDYQHNGNRQLDHMRCERIRWIRAFIEKNCNLSLCNDCDGIKLWTEPYKSRKRIHILLEKEKYMVVLEMRENYFLLITAFYFDRKHALKKKLRKYEHYHNNPSEII